MLPPVMATPTRLPRNRVGNGEQRGDTGGARAFRDHLRTFRQQADRLLDRVFRHHQHVGDPTRG